MNSPLLVYDGGPPKRIIYKIKNKKGKTECKIDLCDISIKYMPKSIPEEDINQIDDILKFPRKNFLDVEEIVAPIEDGPLYFGSVLSDKNYEYIVCFTIFEKQPGRYQCFVLAIVARQ